MRARGSGLNGLGSSIRESCRPFDQFFLLRASTSGPAVPIFSLNSRIDENLRRPLSSLVFPYLSVLVTRARAHSDTYEHVRVSIHHERPSFLRKRVDQRVHLPKLFTADGRTTKYLARGYSAPAPGRARITEYTRESKGNTAPLLSEALSVPDDLRSLVPRLCFPSRFALFIPPCPSDCVFLAFSTPAGSSNAQNTGNRWHGRSS